MSPTQDSLQAPPTPPAPRPFTFASLPDRIAPAEDAIELNDFLNGHGLLATFLIFCAGVVCTLAALALFARFV